MRIFFLSLFFQGSLLAQVGIGTTEPTAALDVNGTLRVRATANETDKEVIRDSILVISRSGNVNRVESTEIIDAALPTMVRASFSSSGDIGHTMSSGSCILTFNNELSDSNNEFDTTTYTFTAKQDGIYHISAQMKISSSLSVSTNIGLGIYKNGSLVAEQNYVNVQVSVLSLLNVNVSPPIRYVTTVIDLNENDTIHFEVTSSLGSINIEGASTESYCAIYQIR
ncbi:hypothetical protein [Tamlana crocina]|uniref:C1q domain-containing protein n=1 Tax=Tamlana crocina TaxID=393006 RepID=A0ABX1DCZ0_9FLAO|nr:hypothetical protein [Tamlana crocina]NJX16215.1 hypothetical protein [Tamlana crocina]